MSDMQTRLSNLSRRCQELADQRDEFERMYKNERNARLYLEGLIKHAVDKSPRALVGIRAAAPSTDATTGTEAITPTKGTDDVQSDLYHRSD